MFADHDFYASLNFADDEGRLAHGGSTSGASDRPHVSTRSGFSQDADDSRPAVRDRVVEVYEEDEPDSEGEYDPDATRTSKRGLIARMREKADRKKRSKAKERAGRKFASQYGGDASSDASAGPRAAVYKGEMGSKHKRAARLQNGADASGGKAVRVAAKRASEVSFTTPSRAFIAVGAVAICLVFCCCYLYAPMQQYYQEMRERDRLQLEYEAVQERYEKLTTSIEHLSTDQGVDDKAREMYGWVREGENAVSVSGFTEQVKTDVAANVVSSSIDFPETWYSGFLDPLFGVS